VPPGGLAAYLSAACRALQRRDEYRADSEVLSPSVTRRLMERVATQAGTYEQARTALAALSPRERDVAVAVAQGRTNAEVASALQMSVATVKAHISHILTKLGLANRTQIALLGHDAGLV
jgi:DNA-binding NarL/FixJ family response regulator